MCSVPNISRETPNTMFMYWSQYPKYNMFEMSQISQIQRQCVNICILLTSRLVSSVDKVWSCSLGTRPKYPKGTQIENTRSLLQIQQVDTNSVKQDNAENTTFRIFKMLSLRAFSFEACLFCNSLKLFKISYRGHNFQGHQYRNWIEGFQIVDYISMEKRKSFFNFFISEK